MSRWSVQVSAWLALGLGLACASACRHPVDPAVLPAPVDGPAAVEAEEPVALLEPGDRWSADGVCLVLPRSWRGSVPAEGLGTLHHEQTGVSVTVRSYDPDEPPDAEREGFTLTFEDQSAYRKIALFEDGGTRTWTSNAPGGPTLQAWFGRVGGRCIELEVQLPFGKAIEGTRAVEGLLAALSTTC